MEVTFNVAKDTSNIAKHGVSLAEAEAFEWDDALIWPDLRRDYGEERMIGIGYIGLRLMHVVFVDRDDSR